MTTELKTLLTLEVMHGYFGRPCEGVGFFVPDDVAQAMRAAKMTFKVVSGGLRVFYRAGVGGAPVVRAEGKVLRVGLVVRDSQLANITEGFDPRADPLHHRNSALPGALDALPPRVALVGRSLTRALARPARPVTVTLKDSADRAVLLHDADRPVSPQTVTDVEQTAVSLDLSLVPQGAYTLEEAYPDSAVRTALFVDPALAREGVFAVVEIRIDETFYGDPPAFQVTLEARRETIRYYVVTRGFSSEDVGLLTVRDMVIDAVEVRDKVGFVNVSAEELTIDERARLAILGADGARALLFRSEEPVPRRDRARKKIQLLKKDQSLIDDLPQPGAGSAAADMIIHLSK